MREAYEAFIKQYPFTLESLDGEEWKPLLGYFNFYHVSNYGRVKTFHHGVTRMKCPILDDNGLLAVDLWKGKRCRRLPLNRLVARLYLPPPPAPNMRLCYIDGDPFNNRADNLRWE